MPYDSGKYEYLFDLVPDEDALRRMRDAHKGRDILSDADHNGGQ